MIKKNIIFLSLAIFVLSFGTVVIASESQDWSSKDLIARVLGEGEWLNRTTVDVNLSSDFKPEWTVETVQPLMQTEDTLRHTVFVQGRYAHSNSTNTVNIGLGYRYLTEDETWLLGANTFFDRTFDEQHQRVGYGLEAIGQYITGRANFYNAISGLKVVSTVSGVTTRERALDGWDAELEGPVPYAPWLRIAAGGYHWDAKSSKDIYGKSVVLRGDITNRLRVELGGYDDSGSGNNHQLYLEFRYALGEANNVDYTAVDGGISREEAFAARDLKKHTLDRVERHHDIVVERTSGTGFPGVVIARGN